MTCLEKKIEILANVNSSQTITELASKLYLSQPYVSRLLKDMEKEYGILLVNRLDRPISLTEAGMMVLNDLKQIYNDQEQMNKNLAQLQRIRNHEVTVMLNSSFCEEDIISVSTGLINNFSDLKFNLTINGMRPQESDLINRNIDILVGPKWNNQLLNIKFLQVNRLALLIPASCTLYHPGRLYCEFSENNLTVLNNINYVETNDNFFLQQRVNHFLAENGIHINKIAKVSSTRLAAKMAMEEKATTITTEKMAKHVLGKRADYNLMVFPRSALNLEVAISMRRDASTEVREVFDYLYEHLKDIQGNTYVHSRSRARRQC